MKTFLIYTLATLLGITVLVVLVIIASWAFLYHWSVGLFTIWLEIIGLCLIAIDALNTK